MSPTNPSDAQDPAEGTAPGTARAFGSEPPLKEPAQPGPDDTPEDAAMAPEGVGESTTRRGEDIVKQEGQEPGREEAGADDSAAGRPAGGSSARHSTGVNPPADPDSAAAQSQ
ncbi:hypothetical protein [Arthrobacter sp. UYEF20]|uniref:hypothetical protein n=1 Tax=Arthrobacter sp. UYEF20 TaxID=1756363 RepID=UPI0033957A18